MTDRKALSSHGLSRQNGLGTQELPQAVHEKISGSLRYHVSPFRERSG